MGLAVVALTDHDTTAGLAEAAETASELTELKFVRGVEISAKAETGTLHILGLGIDDGCPELADALANLRRARSKRNPKIIARLRDLGIDLAMEDVLEAAGEAEDGAADRPVSRLHIAEAMRRRGYVSELGEAFAKYIGSGGPAYVDKDTMAPRQAVRAIRASGGLAALAHPVHLACRNRAQLEHVVRELVSAGIQAIEAYHSDHTPSQTRLYADLGAKLNLAVVGGSDYHGKGKPDVHLGCPKVALPEVFGHPLLRRMLDMS